MTMRWRPGLVLNTCPAARPSFKAVSLVIGSTLATPLIPSVPNSRRIIASFPCPPLTCRLRRVERVSACRRLHRFSEGLGHAGHILHLRHGMNANHMGSLEDSDRHRGGCPPLALLHRTPQNTTHKGLARRPDDDRAVQPAKSRETAKERKVVVGGFSKAEPGIDGDPLDLDAGCHSRFHPRPEKVADLFHNRAVRRMVLHRRRGSLHMHEDETGLRL